MEPVPQSECSLKRKNIGERLKNCTGHTNRVEGELTEVEQRLLERIIELEKKWNWIIGLLVLNLGGIITILWRGQ